MESSDDSFAWMSTSSDSNDSNSEENKMSAVKTKSEEGDSADNKKKVHKRALEGERAASGSEDEPPRKRSKKLKRERAETPAPPAAPAPAPAPAGVKREPASDSDSDGGAGAELARRVKQELAAHPAPADAGDDAHATSGSDAFVNTDRKSEKKKSKKRKKKTSLNTDIKDMIVEDMFSAEETVVERRPRKLSESLSRTNHQHEDNDKANSDIKVYTSKEFVSDISSSDENRKKKKNKNKSRNSEMQKERQKTSDSDVAEMDTEATPVKTIKSPHKQKISDRIRYEDEVEDDLQIENNQHLTNGRSEHPATQSTRLKRFMKSNPQLKAVTACFEGEPPVTRDDEVWVLRCPHEVDITNLRGKDLQLDTKCKLKIDGQAYDGSLNEEKGTVAILSCQNNQIIINNISLIGTVNFRKRIPKPHFIEDNVIVNNQTNFIPLPDTKCRHPLFGSDYKKAMKIPSAIKARLKGENEPKLEHSEKKKKKKKKHREQEYEAETAAAALHEPAAGALHEPAAGALHEPAAGALHEPAAGAPRRHKKRRHAPPPAAEEDVPPTKKSKKIKNEVSADTWESVKAIEESLFNF